MDQIQLGTHWIVQVSDLKLFFCTELRRVNYPPQMWTQLGRAVKSKQLPVEDMFGLLIDVRKIIFRIFIYKVFTLNDSGNLEPSILFQFLLNYREITDPGNF